MLARVKSNGSSPTGRMRSTFQPWKNSCEIVPERRRRPAAFDDESRLEIDRAVAVLHAVAVDPRRVVEQERVVPGSYSGNSPNTAICSRAMLSAPSSPARRRRPASRRNARRGGSSRAPSGWERERAQHEVPRAPSDCREVLQVRRGEGQGVAVGIQLRADLPVRVAPAAERDPDRPVVEAPRPQERRRHVQVRVRRVDAEVGAVGVVAEDLVHAAAPCRRGRPTSHWYGFGRVAWPASGPCRRTPRPRTRSSRIRAPRTVPATTGSSAPASGAVPSTSGTSPRPASSDARAPGRSADTQSPTPVRIARAAPPVQTPKQLRRPGPVSFSLLRLPPAIARATSA